MKKILSLFVATWSFLSIFGQNWEPVTLNNTYNYTYLGSPNDFAISIWVDSVDIINGDSIYYLNTIGSECEACYGFNNSLEINKAHFLQKTVIKKDSGIYILNDPMEFIIRTLADSNEAWIFDSIYNDTATINSVYEDTVFGIADSVKLIHISNGIDILLSKSFGIIYTEDYTGSAGEYNLTGIEGMNVGEATPGFWNYFNYNVGDIFQGYGGCGDPGGCYKDYYKYTVIEKDSSFDTILYLFDRIGYIKNELSGYQQYYTSIDTIIFVNSFSNAENGKYANVVRSGCNCRNMFVYGYDWDNNNFYQMNNDTAYSFIDPYSYFSDIKKVNGLYFDINTTPNVLSMDEIYLFSYNLKNGIGCTYFRISGFEFGCDGDIIAYVINGDTTGTISPDFIYTGIEKYPPKKEIQIYPNPTHDFLNITGNNIRNVIISDISGKNLYTGEYRKKLNVSFLPEGVYILTIYTDMETIRTKLIRQ